MWYGVGLSTVRGVMDDGDRIGELEGQLTTARVQRDTAVREADEARAAYDRMVVARDEAADAAAVARQELAALVVERQGALEAALDAAHRNLEGQERWEARCEELESELEVARGAVRRLEVARRGVGVAAQDAAFRQEVDFVPARASRREPVDAATAGAIEAFGLVDVSRTAYRSTDVPEPRGHALGHEQEPEGPELERLRGERDAMRLFRSEQGVARLGQLRVAGQVADELYLVDGQEVYRVKGEWVPPPVAGEWPPARDDEPDAAALAAVVPAPRVQRLPAGGLVLRCACGAGFAHLPDYVTHWYAAHDMGVER